MSIIKNISLLLLMFTFIVSNIAVAQDDDFTGVGSSAIDDDDDLSLRSMVGYKTVEDIAWIMGNRSLGNDKDIDNFLKINECEMYKEFFPNEFEWKEIREIARDSIAMKIAGMSKTIEYVQPIYVEQYDFKRKGFPIDKNYKFSGHKRFNIKPDDVQAIYCSKFIKRMEYPSSVVVYSKRPVYLTFIPLDIDRAREFSENTVPIKNDDKIYIRPMYIKIKISFIKFKRNYLYLGAGGMVTEYFGIIQGYDIFMDRYLTRSILKKDLRSKKEIAELAQEKLNRRR